MVSFSYKVRNNQGVKMFKLIGENTLTGNTWDCVKNIPTEAEAHELRKGWARLESDYKIEYRVAPQ